LRNESRRKKTEQSWHVSIVPSCKSSPGDNTKSQYSKELKFNIMNRLKLQLQNGKATILIGYKSCNENMLEILHKY